MNHKPFLRFCTTIIPIRVYDPINPFNPKPEKPRRQVWDAEVATVRPCMHTVL